MHRISVVFPAPFGPTSPTTSPRRTVAEKSIQQHPLADGNPHLVQHQRLISAPGGRLQPQRHGAILSGGLAQPAHPLQPAPAPLGLGAVLPRDVAADEVLLRRDGPGLLVERALLGQPPLAPAGARKLS